MPVASTRTSSAPHFSKADRPVHVAILSARSGWHTDELRRALAERGHTADVVAYESLRARIGTDSGSRLQVLPTDSRSPDAVLARIIPNGSLEQIIFRVDALHWLEARGVPVINSPNTIERTVDKFYTSAILADAGIPTPDTVVCEDFATAMTAVREMGDVIVKPIFGSMGHGLVRISDPDVAFRVLRPLEQTRTVYYIQRVVDHDSRDIRAFVVGGGDNRRPLRRAEIRAELGPRERHHRACYGAAVGLARDVARHRRRLRRYARLGGVLAASALRRARLGGGRIAAAMVN